MRSIVLNMDLIGEIKRVLIYTLVEDLDLSFGLLFASCFTLPQSLSVRFKPKPIPASARRTIP